ncbi:MAG TPA: hypothetical protein VGE45_22075 [Chloroflexia bacterium]|jgi:hypothetical protein
MANSYANQADAKPTKDLRGWVLGFGVTALLTLGLGLWLAVITDGVARPWSGLAFLLALALALIVGVSKTSSA